MPERWVVNASPLILLARIGRAGLLTELAAGFRIDDQLVRAVLQTALGEAWPAA